ncbi:ABC transporter ATP-binding protein [Flagellimonas sp. HMM57]|uniref:ATP-binding cassette domain-containing protein n=1 Tax=unclassified Flagellimonas TaxID=2644544 RepID=UPI0013D59C30|nr:MULTISPECIES: ABC transporter ATP-binding protein [unclassified Flagellimonas]UII75094.1 ABC transporter ATP-binding protein [Flagellimonas sp. HMM57]
MVLEIDNIELNFGSKRILSGIYLKAIEGQVTGILGRNGCGKTSLLKILFGSLQPKYKTIRINGRNHKGKLYLSNNIAYLPQHQLLPNGIKVKKIFSLYREDWNRFTDYFDSFKIYKNHSVSELSSGEIRILETYLILNRDSKIIMLDEPFSFIAPIYVDIFKTMIQSKKKEKILIVTDHFYNDIMDIGDTIYLMKGGQSKLISSKDDLVRDGYLSSNSQ